MHHVFSDSKLTYVQEQFVHAASESSASLVICDLSQVTICASGLDKRSMYASLYVVIAIIRVQHVTFCHDHGQL